MAFERGGQQRPGVGSWTDLAFLAWHRPRGTTVYSGTIVYRGYPAPDLERTCMSEAPRMDRSHVEISTLDRQGSELLPASASPADCIGMVWPLTLDAWAFKDASIAESRFQRHAVCVVRSEG